MKRMMFYKAVVQAGGQFIYGLRLAEKTGKEFSTLLYFLYTKLNQ